MKRAFLGLLAAVAVALAACSNNKPVITASSDAASDTALRRDCASPQWKQENLGLWYSVCRQPMHW